MSLSTLTQLLQEGQSSYLCYDLGRLVQPLSNTDFAAIENQTMPYPYPVQGHACFALVFWPQLAASAQDPFLWFLKFPIDERGLLEQGRVHEFITQVITLLGQQVTHALTEEQEQQLQQSPYLFTPTEEKRAALHAKLSLRWQRPPSVHFELAESTLADPQHWQQVGVQGLHDVSARLTQLETTQAAICGNFLRYPEALRQALAVALEHQTVPNAMATELASLLAQQPAGAEGRADLLRSLASQEPDPAIITAVTHVLQQPSVDEVVICCARLWPLFDPMSDCPVPLASLLDALAQQEPGIFAALITDLLRLPGLRPHLLVTLQRDDLPQQVRQAWQAFTGAH
ncbi:DUF3549 family protein [Pseudidiomarina terrestris]|uniref:DUF3549 family protein n=1 Tax=Pseudidiomarina terrestris TaxID=2820060 RepID=A0AAW7QTI2_9GAMM|nr:MULTISPECIES: DUF3549 family protein [unclassified Pseudidiomarina]MDN7123545.1 DUF3549 family protein [Pseudidiomarina sp. 1APP75-32.1]MDN7128731.1 DUF3549 family protein [Pseudidiomarina sp. 1APR75-15]MDN7135010.1 DUF3549 family protein [Pseudidiomarina sp. 1ASP75-5]MEA3587211.1 DUF3549 family protein [Pseudidiomarina sp. 1APP75-27a]